jgi:hypothetical protein
MKMIFSTQYDYYQAIASTIFFIVILSMKFNIGTCIFGVLSLFLGYYLAFRNKIIFYDEYFEAKWLRKSTRYFYSNDVTVSYDWSRTAKGFIKIQQKGTDKSNKGFIRYKDWVTLKKWLESKNVNCLDK